MLVQHCEPTLDQIEAKGLDANIGYIPEGGNCLAVWDEDGVLYRAKLLTWLPDSLKAEVLFTDYGNKDTVCKGKLFSDYSSVPEELRQTALVDINIVTSPLEFDATKPSSQEGLPPAVRHVWSVKAPPGPPGHLGQWESCSRRSLQGQVDGLLSYGGVFD